MNTAIAFEMVPLSRSFDTLTNGYERIKDSSAGYNTRALDYSSRCITCTVSEGRIH